MPLAAASADPESSSWLLHWQASATLRTSVPRQRCKRMDRCAQENNNLHRSRTSRYHAKNVRWSPFASVAGTHTWTVGLGNSRYSRNEIGAKSAVFELKPSNWALSF